MQDREARSLEELLRIVDSIDSCKLDPRQWWTTLPALCALTNSAAAILRISGNGRAQGTFNCGYEPCAPLDEQYFSSAGSSLLGSRFHREWCRPRGLRDALGMVTESDTREMILVLNRPESQSAYSDRDIDLFRLIVPHIRDALKMAAVEALNTARADGIEATLDALAAGLYLIDRQRHVIFMNHAAKCQITAGSVLRISNNRLYPTSPGARDAFESAIAKACSGGDGHRAVSIALSAKQGGGIGLIATALTLNHEQRQRLATPLFSACAVFVQDPQIAPTVPRKAFAKLFGLTSGELDVLSELAEGQAPKGVADVLGLALSTVKSHLHKIFEKTGTLRQADLVRLLMSSSLPIATSMPLPNPAQMSQHVNTAQHFADKT